MIWFVLHIFVIDGLFLSKSFNFLFKGSDSGFHMIISAVSAGFPWNSVVLSGQRIFLFFTYVLRKTSSIDVYLHGYLGK
jgi:hypothetical protein